MSRSDTAAEGGEELCASSAPQAVGAAVIGKVQTVMGLVTITRANVIVDQPAVGDFVYKGDLIETSVGGLIAIAFVDGTEFHLRDDARLVLDEFNYGADKSSQSALLRVVRGMFGVVSGKLATSGRLIIDTPAAQIRGVAPGAGFFGILTFTVFSFGLIRELQAASSDVSFIDDVPVDYKFFKHGVYELVTKGDHPEVIVVDDPTKTIILRARGAGSYSVQEVTNTPQQMAQLQQAYQSAQEIYLRGQQDPLIQQMEHRADANPQSTGSSGSSQFFTDQFYSLASTITTSAPGTGSPGSTGGPGGTPPPSGMPDSAPQTPTATWLGGSGNWSNPLGWSDSWAPASWQNIVINGVGSFVIIDSGTADTGPTSTAATNVTIGAGATLDVISGGSLTVSGTLTDSGLVEVNSGGKLDIKGSVTGTGTFTINSATLEFGGSVAAGVVVVFAGTTGTLQLDQSLNFAGIVSNFQAGDVIDLRDLTFTSGETWTWKQGSGSGTLTINDNGTTEILTLIGTYSQSDFSLVPDSNSKPGTEVLLTKDDIWIGPPGGDWSTSSNWSLGVPGPGSIAFIGTGGTPSIKGSEVVTVDDVIVLNSGDIEVGLASAAILILDDGTTVSGGNLTIGSLSEVEVTAGGATLNGVIVSDSSTLGAGGIEVAALAKLTLNGGTQIDGSGSGTLVIDSSGQLAITGAATLDGLAVDDDSTTSGSLAGIDVAATLTLNGGTQILGGGTGTLTVESTAGSELLIAGSATLDGVQVTDANGTTGIDVASGAILTLNDNTQIIGGGTGTLTVESTGQLVIAAGAGAASDNATAGGATLNGVIVTDSSTLGAGGIEVAALAKLTLDGGTQIDGGGSGTLVIDSSGQLAITGAATLDGLVVDDDTTTSGSLAGIDVAATLTLNGGTQILGGGTGTLTVESTAGSELLIAGSATLDGVQVTDANGTTGIDVASGAILTLNDNTQIIGGGTGTLTVESTGQLVIAAGAGAASDNATAGGATLNGVIVTDDAIGTDSSAGIDVSGAVLTLDDGTQIKGSGSGTLTIEGTSGSQLQITTATGATLDGVVVDDDNTGTGTNAGIYVASGVLTLDDGTQILGGGIGTLTIASTGELSITSGSGATLDGVIVSDLNTTTTGIDVVTTLTLNDGTQINGGGTGTLAVESTGQLEITVGDGADGATAGGATLDGVIVTDNATGSDSSAGIDMSGAVLTLDGGTQINGGGTGTLTIESASGSQLQITTAAGAALDGVVVDDNNTGTGTNAGIYVAPLGILTLDGGTQIQGGPVAARGTLTIASTGELQVTGPATLDGVDVSDLNTTTAGIDVSGAILTLNDSTSISGGMLTVESTTGSELQMTAGTGADGATKGGATLDDVKVTDNNAIDGIDVATGAVLTLNGGTQILGGGSGTMTIAGMLEIDSGSNEISNVIVTDVGTVSQPSQLIVSGGVLTLDGDSFSGGVIEITVESGAELVLNDTHIEDAILDTEPGSTLIIPGNSSIEAINSTLSGNNTIESGASLTLIDETVTGTIDDLGTLVIGAGATIFDGVSIDDDNTTLSPPGIDVLSGATLTLENNAQIYGGGSGTLTIESGGKLSITTAGGATLDGVVVTDNANPDGTTPAIDVAANAVLTLNDGTVVSGGTLTVESAGELVITAGSGGGSEGVPDDTSDPSGLVENPGRGATLNGVIVTDSSTLGAGGIEVAALAKLTLDGGTRINSSDAGTLVIDSSGQLAITGAATLDGLVVDDDTTTSGSLAGIDVAATLTLNGGTQILGGGTGTLTVESAGELSITGTGATLDGVDVSDLNTGGTGIDVAATLTLDDNTQINGGGTGTLTVESTGQLVIAAGAGAASDNATAGGATLNGVIVTDSSTLGAGGIEVAALAKLTLDGGTRINSSDAGTLVIDSSGQLAITGAATLDGLVVDDDTTTSGSLAGIDVAATLTLNGGTQILGGGTGTLTVESAGELSITGTGATLDGVDVSDLNTGGTGIDVAATLTLDDNTQINGGGTGTLTVESTGQLVIAAGAGAASDNATAGGATLNGVIVTDSSTLGAGGIEVAALAKLTLDGGTRINSSDAGTLVIDSSGQLAITGAATLDGLVVDDDTTTSGSLAGIDVAATLTLNGGTQILGGGTGTLTVESAGELSITGTGATLDGVDVSDLNTGGTGIDVAATLTLDDNTQINGGGTGTLTVESTGQLVIAAGAGAASDNATAGGATLNGVIVTDSSTLGAGGIEVAALAKLTLDGGTRINSSDAGTLVIDSSGQLAITGAATLDGLVVDDDTTTSGSLAGIDVAATLTLNGGTQILGGGTGTLTVESAGELSITGTGATLDGVDVSDLNTGGTGIDVAATLTLDDNTQINGGGTGTLTVESTGQLVIAAGAGAASDNATAGGATLNGVIVTDSSTLGAGGIEVAALAKLTLDGGTRINSSDAGTLVIDSSGQLAITGAATLDGLVVDDDTTTSGSLAGIDVAATLTLNGGTQILGGGTGTLTVESAGELSITGTGATLDGVDVSDLNTGGTGIDVAATLTLDDNTQINGGGTGTLQIESGGELLIAAGSGLDSAAGRGATLDGVIVTDNSGFLAGDVGGIEVSGATLTLKDGTQIKGGGSGTMTIETSGAQLQVSTGGATLDNLIVDDDISGTAVGIDVVTTLTLKDGTDIRGGGSGTMTIESAGQLAITTATGAILDGVVVTDTNAGGTNPGIDVASGAVLTLNDQTQIISTDSGTLQIESGGELLIAAGSGLDSAAGRGATLDGVIVTNTGTLEVAGTLTLTNDLVTNSGGIITVDSAETLDLTGSDTINSGQLNNNGGLIKVTNTGNLIENESGGTNGFTNTGTLEVAGTLTLTNDLVTNSGGIITVDSAETLDLTGSDTINSGQLNNNGGRINVSGSGNEIENETGGATVGSGTNSFTNTGTLEVAGTLTLTNDLVTNSGGIITVDSAETLDLTGGDTINSGQLNNNGGLIKVTNTGNLIENESGGTNGFTNTGTLEVAGTLTLTNDLVTNSGGIITVDSAETLDLTGSDTINSGQLNNNGGRINVSGSGNEIENETGGATVGSGTNSFTNTGTLTVLGGGTLTLNDDLLTNTGGIITVDGSGTFDLTGGDTINNGQLNNGGQINVSGSGNEIENETGGATVGSGTNSFTNTGTLTVGITTGIPASGTLTLSSDLVTNSGGIITVDSNGTLDLTGGDTINSGQLNNNGGLIKVTNTGNLIENESGGTNGFTNTGTLEVAGTLTLTNDLVTNSGGIVTVDSNGTLDLIGGDTINSGQLNNNGGQINVSGSGNEIENEAGGATVGSGTNSFTNTGTLTVLGGGTLTLNDDLLTNTGGIITVDGSGTFDLTGGDTINNGRLNNGGQINVSGSGNEIENETGGATVGSGTNSFTNTGTLTVLGGGTLTLNDDLLTNTGGIITVDGSGTFDLTGGDTINNGQLNNGGQINVSGSGNEIENETGGATVGSGTNSFTNTGTLTVLGGGTLTLTSTTITSGTITNNGTLDLAGSDVIGSSVNSTSTGIVDITSGSFADFVSTIFNQNIAFAGTAVGTLELDKSQVYTGDTVSGFGVGTVIDLTYLTYSSGETFTWVENAGHTAGTLTIQDGAATESLTLEGNYAQSNFTLTNDGTLFGGTDVVYVTVDEWTNTSGGPWATASDWSGGIPTSTTTAAIDLSGTYTVTISGTTDTANSLTISDANATLDGSGTLSVGTIDNNGTIDASVANSTLKIIGNITGSGPLQIANNATLELDGTATNTVSFLSGHGTLQIDSSGTSSSFSVTGGAVQQNDVIYLPNIGFSAASDSYNPTTDVVTVGDGNGHNVTIDIVGGLANGRSIFFAQQGTGTLVFFSQHPAGVAGSPINLALANPSAANGQSVSVTVTDVPSDWQLNGGTDLGNGTWTVQTNDLSALTVTTATTYAGAIVLGVTETWINADGSTGSTPVADNVEAYAHGSPIFAWSGDDTLTGAGGNDLFVFAQPIGNDTIYNFNVATDHIDLTGFAGITSFGDLAGDIAGDGSGNTVITLGVGETITVHGVDAASLTANDFVFNETPVLDNAGAMTVSDGAMLPLGGTIDNTGAIALDSTGDATDLQIIGDGATLEGGGQVILSDSSENMILGTNANATLTNVDNTISGAGQIGTGDGNLTLVNETAGTIDANVAGGILTLDTGSNIITNCGTLEASKSGELDVHSVVDNAGGTVEAVSGGHVDFLGAISGGNATIEGGTLEFGATSNVSVTFNNDTGYGVLVLDNPTDFTGQISGFAGTAPDATHSDVAELLNFADSSWSVQTCGSGEILTLCEANGGVVQLTFADFTGTFVVSSDGHGDTLIYDPPATGSSGGSSTAAAMTNTTTGVFSTEVHIPPPDNTSLFGGDQVIALLDKASLLGGDQIVAPPDKTSGLDDHSVSSPINTSVFGADHTILPPVTDAAGSATSFLSAASINIDQGLSLDGDQSALASGLHGGSTQTLLSSLLNVLSGDDIFAFIATSASGGDHGTAPVIGSGAANSEVTHSTLATAPTNEQVMAPALATSPTLASATFGTLGNDNFAFHPSLGSDMSPSTGAATNELAHVGIQVGGPALGSTAPEFHAEFAFDVIHQDDTHVAATVDQFHQMATNSTLLH